MDKITWIWDPESEWDPYTLLGSIKIENGDGEFILDECTILDSWVEPLMIGLQRINLCIPSEFDLIDEPGLLIFKLENNSKIIEYENRQVTIVDERNLLQQLKQICNKAIEIINNKGPEIDHKAVETLAKVALNC